MTERAVDHAVPLPNSTCGAHMYAQGFGTWRGDNALVGSAVAEAIKSGYRLIDCARMYGNEKAIGASLAKCIKEGIVKREELYIVAKIWNTDHEPSVARAAALQSIKDLQCDYLDLLLIHWPVAWVHPQGGDVENQTEWYNIDPATGGSIMADVSTLTTYKAMEALVDEKLVRDIGVSNFTIEEVEALLQADIKYKPVTNQVEVHPSCPNDALREYCESKGMIMMAYKPYGIGSNDVANGLLNNPTLATIAADAGLPSAAHLLLQWSCQKGNVVLCKSTTPSRIAMNAAVPFGGLSEETISRVAEFSKENLNRLCNPDTFTAKKERYFNN